VLDAIIDYGGALVVVVENKVAESDDYQARHLDLAGACVRIGEKQARVEVVWRQVIESLVSLQEKRLVNGAEAVLLEDFLTYVEDYFPSLGPLRTLALCRRNYGRMERRLRQLLAETAEANAVWSSYRPMVRLRSDLVAHAYLGVDDDVKLVELSAFPADTLGQARILYERPDVVDALAALDDRPEWSVTPNFHFGFTQRNYCWTRTCACGGSESPPARVPSVAILGIPTGASWLSSVLPTRGTARSSTATSPRRTGRRRARAPAYGFVVAGL